MPVGQAREAARKNNLDLVEVAPTAVPPVCRLLDYGKYKYEQDKKERQLRRTQRVALLREVRLRPAINNHDFEAKIRLAVKLLNEGDRVKVTVMFRGREITHPEIGWKLLQRVAESIREMASVERQPILEGKRMSVIFSPLSIQKVKEKEEKEKEEVKQV
jgi:translation initiation factor IF-3